VIVCRETVGWALRPTPFARKSSASISFSIFSEND